MCTGYKDVNMTKPLFFEKNSDILESKQTWLFYIGLSEKAFLWKTHWGWDFKGKKDSALRNKKGIVYLEHGRLKGDCNKIRLLSWERSRR